MNRLFLTGALTIISLVVFLFLSCKQDAGKKELWAVVINFFSPDSANYPATKKFPFPDSLKFVPLEGYFINKNIPPIINDSSIIFQDNYRVNGQTFCCKKDTLEVYIDSIKGKKYLFAIGEYVAVFQSNSTSDTNLRARVSTPSVPLWDIQLNTPYSSEKFKDEYEKLGAKLVKLDERFDEVYKQNWSENNSILVETIQFPNSADRIVTAVYKDMNRNEVDSTIDYLRTKFPHLTYEEAIQPGSDGIPLKDIRISFQGISISITQGNATEYSFMVTDYYETIKLILNNTGTGYIFRDDIRIY
jgi:hypothetical protein